MSAGIKGVSATQDARYINKEKKLLRTMKFPKEFDLKVDLKKVNWEVMKTWIAQRVTELLGIEDDVLIGYVFEQLDPETHKTVDPRQLQIALTGFLEKNTSLFCKELWLMLHSAASNETGIPQAILDLKQEELRQRQQIKDAFEARLREQNREREDKERQQREKDREAERQQRDRDREADRKREKEREAERALRREKDGVDVTTGLEMNAPRGGEPRTEATGTGTETGTGAHATMIEDTTGRGVAAPWTWMQQAAAQGSAELLPIGRSAPATAAACFKEAGAFLDDSLPLPPPPPRPAAPVVGVDGDSDRERRHREKREKKERKALKKEKKRLKKEAKHDRRSGSRGAASPSRSSGSEPDAPDAANTDDVDGGGGGGGAPAEKRALPPVKQAPLDLRALRQKALENATAAQSERVTARYVLAEVSPLRGGCCSNSIICTTAVASSKALNTLLLSQDPLCDMPVHCVAYMPPAGCQRASLAAVLVV
eukprot:CAMPEP_0206144030 /NCGR_PEP_ID=MMETSP1473-20131121/22765_1 /ASSEMBLY_ACC=CAM_ASM_001109 /TAXON_ID=1461547 /ORGANISM="Stichococcus sp, Strain RCC1054" /LENGTH=484 /DNA_ID=CAMNT_0053539703 /DNA_START=131 /DNA_END=1589 /DNA_ORIENTATION=+